MKNFTMIFLLAIALIVSTSSAMAQKGQITVTNPEIVDLGLGTTLPPQTVTLGTEIRFEVLIFRERGKAATGVTVTAQLPEGIAPTSVQTNEQGSCAFDRNLIVCNFPKIGMEGTQDFEAAAGILIKARPIVAGEFKLSANITAITPDPNPANNSLLSTVTVVEPPTGSVVPPPVVVVPPSSGSTVPPPAKPRKRVRVF